MAYTILLLTVLTLCQATNTQAQQFPEFPECSKVGGSCEVTCEDDFLIMSMPSCDGNKVCCRKSVNMPLEIYTPSLELSARGRKRNGRCRSKRCRKAKGACLKKEHTCKTVVLEGLCNGINCQCCLKDNCKSKKGKKGCSKKGGECKLKAVGCSGDQTEESGCKGNRCVCCMGPPPEPRPYCDKCGLATIEPTRIVGGQETDIGEYPWQVFILLNEPNGIPDTQAFCGGSLIKNRWVLTAAHCFPPDVTYTGMVVSLGDHNSKDGTEVFSETYLYSDVDIPNFVTVHPDWNNPEPNDNDIAVIKLKYDAPSRKNIKKICLAAPEDIVDDGKAIATGWGHVEYKGNYSDVLMEVELDLISGEECTDLYADKNIIITDNMICTLTQDKDACQGDSGGPLIRQIPDGRWVQIGIVSFGFQCAFNNAPGVYTNVVKQMDWIDQATGSTTCS